MTGEPEMVGDPAMVVVGEPETVDWPMFSAIQSSQTPKASGSIRSYPMCACGFGTRHREQGPRSETVRSFGPDVDVP